MTKIDEDLPVKDRRIDEIKKEVDQLTTVWTHEEEKTKNMQKLISSLFMEVTDVGEAQKEQEALVKKISTQE